MIVRFINTEAKNNNLTPQQTYFVIGIEADDFRILNDAGKPYLYSSDLFEIVDSYTPDTWLVEYGEDGEQYAYPQELNEVGFFEDFFDGVPQAITTFWKVVNQQLAQAI